MIRMGLDRESARGEGEDERVERTFESNTTQSAASGTRRGEWRGGKGRQCAPRRERRSGRPLEVLRRRRGEGDDEEETTHQDRARVDAARQEVEEASVKNVQLHL